MFSQVQTFGKQEKLKWLLKFLIPLNAEIYEGTIEEISELQFQDVQSQIKNLFQSKNVSEPLEKIYYVYGKQRKLLGDQNIFVDDNKIEEINIETIYFRCDLKKQKGDIISYRNKYQNIFLEELKTIQMRLGITYQLVGDIKQGKTIQSIQGQGIEKDGKFNTIQSIGKNKEIFINNEIIGTLDDFQIQLQQRVYKKQWHKIVGSGSVNYPFQVYISVKNNQLNIISIVMVQKVEQQQWQGSQQARFDDEFYFMLVLQCQRDYGGQQSTETVKEYLKSIFIDIQELKSQEQIRNYFSEKCEIHFSQKKFVQKHLETLQKNITLDNVEQIIEQMSEELQQINMRAKQLQNFIKEKQGNQHFQIYHETQDEIQKMFRTIQFQMQEEFQQKLTKDQISPADIFIVFDKNVLNQITIVSDLEAQFESNLIIPVSLKVYEQTGEQRQKFGKIQPSQWVYDKDDTNKQAQQMKQIKSMIQGILQSLEKQKTNQEIESVIEEEKDAILELIDTYLQTVDDFRQQLNVSTFEELSSKTQVVFNVQTQLQKEQYDLIQSSEQNKVQLLIDMIKKQQIEISKQIQVQGEITIQKYLRGLLQATEQLKVLIQMIERIQKEILGEKKHQQLQFLRSQIVKEQYQRRKNNTGLLKIQFIQTYLFQIKATATSQSYVLPTPNDVKVIKPKQDIDEQVIEQIQKLIEFGEGINLDLGFYTFQPTNIILIELVDPQLIQLIGKRTIRMQLRYYSNIQNMQFEQIKQLESQHKFLEIDQSKGEIQQQLIIGRFQPVTISHKYIVDKQLKENEQVVIQIVQGEKTSKDFNKNPFPFELRKMMWEKIYQNELKRGKIYIQKAQTGYIPDIIKQVEEENPMIYIDTIYAGYDRIISYKQQIQRQKLDREIRFVSIDEGVLDQRQTLVRELLRNEESDQEVKKYIPQEIYPLIPTMRLIVRDLSKLPRG